MMLALWALLSLPPADASCTVWLATEETSKFGVHVRADRLPPEIGNPNPTGTMWRIIDGEWSQRDVPE